MYFVNAAETHETIHREIRYAVPGSPNRTSRESRRAGAANGAAEIRVPAARTCARQRALGASLAADCGDPVSIDSGDQSRNGLSPG